MGTSQSDGNGFKSLLQYVGGTFDLRRSRRVALLSELTPRIQAARRVERELDRHLARRFNVFKYLRTDELGLSRIIADLLDPAAEHGQKKLFLETLLGTLPETCKVPGAIQDTNVNPIKVVTERAIPSDRRIDISVDIPTDEGSFCLALENKPYAVDLPNQIICYLKFLKRNYQDRFLLLYVPPYDREPDESSLPKKDREKWHEHFLVMPYAGGELSLENWLVSCRRRCDTERLNWFLLQAQSFCRQQFGGSALSTDAETREIRAYLSENPGHLPAALAIHDAWPSVREKLCEGFLNHLRNHVEARLGEIAEHPVSEYRVACQFEGEKRYSSLLWVARNDWPDYSVKLQCGGRGTTWWQWGVSSRKPLSEMSDQEKQVRRKVVEALSRHRLTVGEDDGHHWPQREYVREYENWHRLAPEFEAEIDGRRSEITDFYISRLLRIAESAIPAIDKIAKTNPATPSP